MPTILGLVGAVALLLGLLASGQGWLILLGVFFLAQTAIYMHTTLRGKFTAWQKLLDELDLGGGEQLLDIGCGRGAVLLAAARRLPHGQAHGVDLWRSSDQSGNEEARTARNAEAEGVSDRVRLHTGDMTELEFADGSFSVVTSSLAIHNLPDLQARLKAVDEALRVLEPGGKLVIADIRSTNHYAKHLRSVEAADVSVESLGPRGWFGGPWQAMKVVAATKPEQSSAQ